MHWWVDVWEIIKAGWFYALAAAVGTLLAHWFFYTFAFYHSRRKFNKQQEEIEARDQAVMRLKAELLDARTINDAMQAELRELRHLSLEKRNHDRAWAMRVKDAMTRSAK